jgi:hypothetical protein
MGKMPMLLFQRAVKGRLFNRSAVGGLVLLTTGSPQTGNPWLILLKTKDQVSAMRSFGRTMLQSDDRSFFKNALTGTLQTGLAGKIPLAKKKILTAHLTARPVDGTAGGVTAFFAGFSAHKRESRALNIKGAWSHRAPRAGLLEARG